MGKCPFFLFLRVNADADVGNVDAPDAEGTGQRVRRDAQEHDRVNDYVSIKHGMRRWSGLHPLLHFLHINRWLIDVKTDFVHWRAEQLLYISV